MKALLFGSIGTIVETSEMQRDAFNRAFALHGLDWHWSRDIYRSLLSQSGGRMRIKCYADEIGVVVDAKEIHVTKTHIFQELMDGTDLVARDGVVEALNYARISRVRTAFVSTTDLQSINRVRAATKGLRANHFDIVTSSAMNHTAKPSPNIYNYVLETFGLVGAETVAIEDNVDGVAAAQAAGCHVVAFPGHNTQTHDYGLAHEVVLGDLFPALKRFLNKVSPEAA